MSKVKIIPLGGVRENGKNAYIIEVDDNIFVLDCGLKYPESELLGIDVVIPEFSYLVENASRVVGVFLTHGHADAIGGLSYLLADVEVPVFGSELTIELAKLTVSDYSETKKFNDFHVVNEETEIDFGENITISFFKTTHTIPNTLGIVVETAKGSIVYTGDFKFDQAIDPIYQTDFSRLAQIGSKGVLALLSDSANADNSVQIASEHEVSEKIDETIRYWDGRIIVASVASNLMRIQQVLNAAHKFGRKVLLTGQDLELIMQTAMKIGKLKLPGKKLLISDDHLAKIPDKELLILETGRMGEPIKALQKMANGDHKNIRIKKGDLVFITTTPSIAMETFVAKTEDLIYRAGGEVKMISTNMRVSGHANPCDLQLMLNLLKPKHFLPVQGEYRQLAAHAKLAYELGINPQNVHLTNKGDVLEYHQGRLISGGEIPADNVMIDGIGVGDIGSVVLNDRRILSEDGVLLAVATVSRRDKVIVSEPQITSRGFVYVKSSHDILKKSRNIVTKVLNDNLALPEFEWNKVKKEIRDSLARYLFEQTKRRPIILSIIMEYSSKN
ncbi:MAG: ribonuclease J [Streptococcaceae bacterium]|jgi:ribonuclease J|nr:ribonuclease J [Streptococcaceae bacterium]